MTINGFRILLVLIWIVLAIITGVAFQELGVSGMMVVLTDASNLWRAQIYADFIFHAVVLVCWILYREKSRKIGMLCSAGVLVFGGLFTFMYLLVTTMRSEGDVNFLLTGRAPA